MAFELFCCECEVQIYPYVAFRSKDEAKVFETALCRNCWGSDD